MLQSILVISTILFIGSSFNIAALVPSKIHCVKKEINSKHKSEIRLKVNYAHMGVRFGPFAYGTHDSTDPKDKSDADYEDPGSNNTYCYPVQAFNNNLTEVSRLFDFRIDVKHASDCQKWDLSNQVNVITTSTGQVVTEHLSDPADYSYDDSTQTYALRYYHYGVHTHCKTRSRVYAK